MGTTATTPVHLLSTTFDFTVRDNRPITVEGVIATLHRVETETPWRFEDGSTGVQHPAIRPLSVDRLLPTNLVLQEGSYRLSWVYPENESISRSQSNAFAAYLDRIRKRLEEELGIDIGGATVKMTMVIVFD